MFKKLCPHLYALTLVCSSNLIVEIAPYSGILCLNGWTYNSLPLILVLRSFRDFYLPLYKCWKAFLSIIIFHCRKPPRYVLYKCTHVPYDGTFGASNQGQTLDVWQGENSQIHHLIRQIRRFAISSVRKKSNQKRYCRIRFSTTILDHMDRN